MRPGRPGGWGRTAVAMGLLVAVGACGDSPAGPAERMDIDLSLPWQSAEPSALGMDVAALERAASRAGALHRMRSLVVVREGRIALERYYNGFGPDSLADVRSVTKSVISVLTGISMEQGGISSLDLTLGELVPRELAIPTAAQAPITLRHLLTMSGGFLWDESGVREYNDWRRSGDFVQYLLDRPVVTEPGTAFNYNSAAAHLLSVLVERSMGAALTLFANVSLFQPVGISRGAWEGMIDGTVNGGSGLDLRPRDLARLGQLYLQNGWSGRRQIVPESWVELTTEPVYEWSIRVGSADGITYGHLWWVDRDRDAFFAWGYGGQFLYVVPERQLVVVTTTDWTLLSQEGGPAALEGAVMDIIVEDVVRAAPPISGSR